jgi:hypothetical protein
VITGICVESPGRSNIRLLSEEPHAFAVCPQRGIYFLGKVHALIDDHTDFARRQPVETIRTRACHPTSTGAGNEKPLPHAGADGGISATTTNL